MSMNKLFFFAGLLAAATPLQKVEAIKLKVVAGFEEMAEIEGDVDAIRFSSDGRCLEAKFSSLWANDSYVRRFDMETLKLSEDDPVRADFSAPERVLDEAERMSRNTPSSFKNKHGFDELCILAPGFLDCGTKGPCGVAFTQCPKHCATTPAQAFMFSYASNLFGSVEKCTTSESGDKLGVFYFDSFYKMSTLVVFDDIDDGVVCGTAFKSGDGGIDSFDWNFASMPK